MDRGRPRSSLHELRQIHSDDVAPARHDHCGCSCGSAVWVDVTYVMMVRAPGKGDHRYGALMSYVNFVPTLGYRRQITGVARAVPRSGLTSRRRPASPRVRSSGISSTTTPPLLPLRSGRCRPSH